MKKLVKIILIILLIVISISGLVTAYTYYSDKSYATIDEEVAFKCKILNDEKHLRIILSSSPKSRATSSYYDTGFIIGYEKSKINETQEAKFKILNIYKRTVDFIYFNSYDSGSFKLNRKNLEFSVIEQSHIDINDYIIKTVSECTEVTPKEIKDFVDEINKEANKTNKV